MLENDRMGQEKSIHFKFELYRLSVNVESTVLIFEELKKIKKERRRKVRCSQKMNEYLLTCKKCVKAKFC